MSSVTRRIQEIKQPKGGFIKPSEFEAIVMQDNTTLNSEENIHPSVIGIAVDYLTRFIIGTDVRKAFRISLKGAEAAEIMGQKKSISVAEKLLKGIKGLDNTSVVNACKLVTFDVWYRSPLAALNSKGYDETNPDKMTIQNIQIMVKRSLSFFEKYGPITSDGFSFEPVNADISVYEKMMKTGKGSFGGYTPTVSSGDGDFLTKDTLWDFKVLKSKPTNKHTLQLLMYWIMGQHSGQEVFKKIIQLGIFNPRLNTVYLLKIEHIPKDVIKTVEKEVICY